jgi:4-amino-4-deoxy-L-arabinose transferase-like glycosyltransferase
MRLQEFIHSLEVGAGARILKGFAVILGFGALALCYDLRAYRNFNTQEAMDAGQLAHNIAEGRGFTTQFIRPLAVHLFEAANTNSIPRWDVSMTDISNPPVYPTLLAGLMKILPFHFAAQQKDFASYQPELWICLFNQALFFVSVVLLYKLARRMFDPPVAWLSAGLFAAAEVFWHFSVSGLSTMLLVTVILGIAWALWLIDDEDRKETARTKRMFVLALVLGLLIGVAGLTRYSFILLLAPVLFVMGAFLTRSRILLISTVTVVSLAVVAPWLIRNYQLSEKWFGTAGFAIYEGTPAFPEDRVERSIDPTVGMGLLEPQDFAEKFFTNCREILQEGLPRLGGSWVTAFFLVGLLLPFRNPGLSRLRFFVVLSLVLFIGIEALGRTHLTTDSPVINSENLLVVFAPLVFMFGAALFFILLEQLSAANLELRFVMTAFFVLICCLPYIFTFLPPPTYPVTAPYFPNFIQRAAHWMSPNELMMSDVPWSVAWYGDRQCAWVTPNDDEQFFKLNDVKKVQAIYLTQRTTDRKFLSHMVIEEKSWERFVSDAWTQYLTKGQYEGLPNNFPLTKAPVGFLPDQLFLSDKVRWQARSSQSH